MVSEGLGSQPKRRTYPALAGGFLGTAGRARDLTVRR